MTKHVYRNVAFFRKDENTIIAARAHKGEFDPDKHTDWLRCEDCYFGGFRTKDGGWCLKVRHVPTNSTYYGDYAMVAPPDGRDDDGDYYM